MKKRKIDIYRIENDRQKSKESKTDSKPMIERKDIIGWRWCGYFIWMFIMIPGATYWRVRPLIRLDFGGEVGEPKSASEEPALLMRGELMGLIALLLFSLVLLLLLLLLLLSPLLGSNSRIASSSSSSSSKKLSLSNAPPLPEPRVLGCLKSKAIFRSQLMIDIRIRTRILLFRNSQLSLFCSIV